MPQKERNLSGIEPRFQLFHVTNSLLTSCVLEPTLVIVKSVEYSTKHRISPSFVHFILVFDFAISSFVLFRALKMSEHFTSERKKSEGQPERRIIQLSNSLAWALVVAVLAWVPARVLH